MTKEAFPFLLLLHGREVADGEKFPGAVHEEERETERERCGAKRREGREITGMTIEGKKQWARETQSKAFLA